MNTILSKMKSDPRKAVGVIFFSVGIFLCVIALLFLAARAIRVGEIGFSANEIGKVLLVENDEITISYLFPGCFSPISKSQYATTAFRLKQYDFVGVYDDPYDQGNRLVLDLLDENGKSVIVKVCARVILVGILLCALGTIIFVGRKVLSKKVE